MKSRKIVLTVLLLVLGLSTVAHASAVKVAFVDFDFLVGAHPEYELKVTEFQDTRAKMIESFQKEIADIESESEIDAIAQKYDLELQELYEEMQTYLVESILGFIEEVAKGKRFTSTTLQHGIIWRIRFN